MKTLKYLKILGGTALIIVGAGCVRERVTYVTQVPAQPVYQPPPQEPQPPPAPPPIIRTSAELDRMLAPIALYPDPLTAQILPAATEPDQVAAANNYVRAGGDPAQVENQPWDQSVKAMIRFPDVLRMMAGNLAWTTDLGIAFVNQEGDVMDSIQRLRAQAQALGNLRTTPEQVVVIENRVIQIVPATPQIVYVPVYRPEIVFVQPPPARGFHIYFGAGCIIGPWLDHDLDWRDRHVIVWHPQHPRPREWWYEPPSRHERMVVVNNNTTVINNNTTVVNNYTVWKSKRSATETRGHDESGSGFNRLGGPRSTGTTTVAVNPRTIPTPKDPKPHPRETGPEVVTKRPVRNEVPVTPLPAPRTNNPVPPGTRHSPEYTVGTPANPAQTNPVRTELAPRARAPQTNAFPQPKELNREATKPSHVAPTRTPATNPHPKTVTNTTDRVKVQQDRKKQVEPKKAVAHGTNSVHRPNETETPK